MGLKLRDIITFGTIFEFLHLFREWMRDISSTYRHLLAGLHFLSSHYNNIDSGVSTVQMIGGFKVRCVI